MSHTDQPLPVAITATSSPDNNMRIGEVSQTAPLIVNVQGGLVVSPGVLQYAQFSVGDTVALLRQDQSWLVQGAVASSDSASLTGQVAFSNPPGADSTAVAGYTNFGVGTDLTWTKRIAGTKLRIDFTSSCYTTAVNTAVQFGMDVFNSDNAYQFTMCRMLINTANEHTTISGGTLTAGSAVAPGTYTIQPLWLRFSGAGTLTSGTDDWLAYFVSEVN